MTDPNQQDDTEDSAPDAGASNGSSGNPWLGPSSIQAFTETFSSFIEAQQRASLEEARAEAEMSRQSMAQAIDTAQAIEEQGQAEATVSLVEGATSLAAAAMSISGSGLGANPEDSAGTNEPEPADDSEHHDDAVSAEADGNGSD